MWRLTHSLEDKLVDLLLATPLEHWVAPDLLCRDERGRIGWMNPDRLVRPRVVVVRRRGCGRAHRPPLGRVEDDARKAKRLCHRVALVYPLCIFFFASEFFRGRRRPLGDSRVDCLSLSLSSPFATVQAPKGCPQQTAKLCCVSNIRRRHHGYRPHERWGCITVVRMKWILQRHIHWLQVAAKFFRMLQ
jgi:hypothetical protein